MSADGPGDGRPVSIDVERLPEASATAVADVGAASSSGPGGGLSGIGAELGALMSDVGTLVRTESRLAVQEVVDGVKALQAGVTLAAIGGVVAFLGAIVLVAALVIGLAVLIGSEFWAALIVAAVLLGVGWLLLQSGIAKAKTAQLKPTQAIRNVEKDVAAVKQAVTHKEGPAA